MTNKQTKLNVAPSYSSFLRAKLHVGSEVYGAVLNGRRGIGIELKPSYYRQAVKNLASCKPDEKDGILFDDPEEENA